MKSLVFLCSVLVFVSGDLKPNCDCVDWYGRCQDDGVQWVDDDTWSYSCSKPDTQFVGCVATARGENKIIASGSQDTINGFWFKCEQSDDKLRYEQEPHCNVNGTDYHVGDTFRDGIFERICLHAGIWVTACHYTDETGAEQMIRVGERAFEGVVRHNCIRVSDYPGRVQYWTDLRDDVTVAAPHGKGESQIRPESLENILDNPPKPWLKVNSADLIRMDNTFDIKIRYVN